MDSADNRAPVPEQDGDFRMFIQQSTRGPGGENDAPLERTGRRGEQEGFQCPQRFCLTAVNREDSGQASSAAKVGEVSSRRIRANKAGLGRNSFSLHQHSTHLALSQS